MNALNALNVVGFVAYVIGLAVAAWLAKRARDEAAHAVDTALILLDMLEVTEEARDPGREVHERFARELEAGMVKDAGRANVPMRRAAAMAMAANMIDAIDRAGLTLVPNEATE